MNEMRRKKEVDFVWKGEGNQGGRIE